MVEDTKILHRPSVEKPEDWSWTGSVIDPSNSAGLPVAATDKERRQEAGERIKESAQMMAEISTKWLPQDLSEPLDDLMDEIDNLVDVWIDVDPMEEPAPVIEDAIIDDSSSSEWTPPEPIDPEMLAAIRAGDLPEIIPNRVEYPVGVQGWPSLDTAARDVMRSEMQIIKDDFMTELMRLMQGYMYDLLQLRIETGVFKLEDLTGDFFGDHVKVDDPELWPIRDSIVRSQILRRQLARLFRKTHSIDNTLFHMRSIVATNEQWARATERKLIAGDSMINMAANEIKIGSQADYERRYRQSMGNFYRYLMGSLPVLRENLRHLGLEAKAKAILLKAGVNIFATADTASVGSNTKTTETKQEQSSSAAVGNVTTPAQSVPAATTTTTPAAASSTAPSNPAVTLPPARSSYREGGSLW